MNKVPDLVLTKIAHDGPGDLYQSNLWDVMRALVTPATSIDLLVGDKQQHTDWIKQRCSKIEL
jgi:hypothetical protein